MDGRLKGLLREPHDTSDLISALSEKERYIDNFGPRDESELVSELASFLRSKYRKNYYKGSSTPKRIAETKARAILDLDELPEDSNIERFYKPKNLASKRPIERFSEVIDAMNAGRLSQIKLNFPWHPQIFTNENMPTTFPFQHTSAILYTGQPKHVFFSEEGKKFMFEKYDRPRNPGSILVQGSLRGGNKYNNAGNETAVYMGSLKTAQGYPMGDDDEGIREGIYHGSPILEVHVPTKRLEIWRGGDNPGNVADMKRIYSTPDEYLKECRNNNSIDDFMLSKGGSSLPVENIVGVWDREYSPNIPYFIPLKQYYRFLKKKHPGRLPDPEETVLNVKDVDVPEYEKEVKAVARFEKLLEEIPTISPPAHSIENMNGTVIENPSDLEDFEHKMNMLLRSIKTYDKELQQLRKAVENNFTDQNINWKELEFTEFIRSSARGEYTGKEREIQGQIRRTANNHIEKNVNKEELKKAEKELIHYLKQLPLLNLDEKEFVKAGFFLVDLKKSKIGNQQLEKTLLNTF